MKIQETDKELFTDFPPPSPAYRQAGPSNGGGSKQKAPCKYTGDFKEQGAIVPLSYEKVKVSRFFPCFSPKNPYNRQQKKREPPF